MSKFHELESVLEYVTEKYRCETCCGHGRISYLPVHSSYYDFKKCETCNGTGIFPDEYESFKLFMSNNQ